MTETGTWALLGVDRLVRPDVDGGNRAAGSGHELLDLELRFRQE